MITRESHLVSLLAFSKHNVELIAGFDVWNDVNKLSIRPLNRIEMKESDNLTLHILFLQCD